MINCHNDEMSDIDQGSSDRAELEVSLNRHSFGRNLLFMALFFLAYIALAIFASGILRVLGVVGAVVFGVIGLCGGIAGTRQNRSRRVLATLNQFGVTFDRREPTAWEKLREVRRGRVKPGLLFVMRPLHYIAFVPNRISDLPGRTARERLAIRMYGTSLVLMTETVVPAGDEILAAVERLSDVPVRR